MPTELGSDYVALWGQDPALWVNSNESPHFPYGAQIWLAAWQAQHGQRLDGVLALIQRFSRTCYASQAR